MQLADNIIVYEKNPEECTKKAARTKWIQQGHRLQGQHMKMSYITI